MCDTNYCKKMREMVAPCVISYNKLKISYLLNKLAQPERGRRVRDIDREGEIARARGEGRGSGRIMSLRLGKFTCLYLIHVHKRKILWYEQIGS